MSRHLKARPAEVTLAARFELRSDVSPQIERDGEGLRVLFPPLGSAPIP